VLFFSLIDRVELDDDERDDGLNDILDAHRFRSERRPDRLDATLEAGATAAEAGPWPRRIATESSSE